MFLLTDMYVNLWECYQAYVNNALLLMTRKCERSIFYVLQNRIRIIYETAALLHQGRY